MLLELLTASLRRQQFVVPKTWERDPIATQVANLDQPDRWIFPHG